MSDSEILDYERPKKGRPVRHPWLWFFIGICAGIGVIGLAIRLSQANFIPSTNLMFALPNLVWVVALALICAPKTRPFGIGFALSPLLAVLILIGFCFGVFG